MYAILLALFLCCTSVQSFAEVLFQDTKGNNTPFSTLKGKWILINYWAEWCDSCLEEIPELNSFYQRHQKDPIALYAVNYDALSLLEQQHLIDKLKINYPNLIHDPGPNLSLGDIRALPVTFIFNPQGQLVETLYGGQTQKSLERLLKHRMI